MQYVSLGGVGPAKELLITCLETKYSWQPKFFRRVEILVQVGTQLLRVAGMEEEKDRDLAGIEELTDRREHECAPGTIGRPNLTGGS